MRSAPGKILGAANPGGRSSGRGHEEVRRSVRKYIVSVIATVDGYFEGPGKDVMAMPFDDGFSRYNLELLRNADTVVHGSRWFDGGAYWSRVADDETEPGIEREIGRINAPMHRLVISDSLQVDPTWPWAERVRIVPVAAGPAEVAAVKQGEGRDLLSFGSATTWNPLLEAGLVDELHVLIGPALLGGGTKLFSGARRHLRLLESRVLDDSQLVLLRYDATPHEPLPEPLRG
jgi:dihydrofolate reductase